MLICHCNGVSDRTIRRVVREGATSVGEVGRACGAGACCGGCANAVKKLIHTEAAHRSETPTITVASLPSTT
ncbi:MAG: (2Fe-2S)-binding protein [Deltaproteobacteria bacterium]|jgi:bacterioferritin-associated ferredoxin|nr:(2Fe-2S)-binding protein [Deltaproteobacteria bacterium]MBW2698198.1 (2Fe-2S)-binding protein [Deltaproteobacteria bacterium]